MDQTLDIETVRNAARLHELRETIDLLQGWGAERGWVGSDPYEGLNAKRAGPLARSSLGRRALIQLVKRSPLNLRRPLGIAPRANAAALGHALSGYSRYEREPYARERWAESLVQKLRDLWAPGYEEPCWCYPFDVESRVFFYPRTTPNTIATAFAGLGLLDAYEALGGAELLELAEGSGDFFLRHVPQTRGGEGAFFGYFPGDRTPIHNASMLACGLLARLAAATGRDDFREAAAAGVRFALAHQRADGSWPYGERAGLKWVDSFHTGYMLDSLHRCGKVLDVDGLDEAYDRGLAYYGERLFMADGTAKYFEGRIYPIDSQCVAQGIATFSLGSEHEERWLGYARRVFQFGLRRMRRRDGAFLFQRGRWWRNPTPHMRWVQAPMFDALTLLEAAEVSHAQR